MLWNVTPLSSLKRCGEAIPVCTCVHLTWLRCSAALGSKANVEMGGFKQFKTVSFCNLQSSYRGCVSPYRKKTPKHFALGVCIAKRTALGPCSAHSCRDEIQSSYSAADHSAEPAHTELKLASRPGTSN